MYFGGSKDFYYYLLRRKLLQSLYNLHSRQQSCPECGATELCYVEQIKSQKRINNLQVYCSMKARGCGWLGALDHLDPHQDNCQYVDTKCPLNYLKTIPKNNLDDHLAQHCVKRAYVCRYCSFKATYEEVVDTSASMSPWTDQTGVEPPLNETS